MKKLFKRIFKRIRKTVKRIRIRKTVKRVNRALNIELTGWQINYIFYDRLYPAEISTARCNGKTLAHILRVCLKTDVQIAHEPIIIHFRLLSQYETRSFLIRNAGEDRANFNRMRFFLHELRDTYDRLSKVKRLKLRDIQFKY